MLGPSLVAGISKLRQAARSKLKLQPCRHMVGGSCSGAPKILLGRHVREAIANNSPIVALESTVITHGLPEPENLSLALRLEQVVRQSCGGPSCSNDIVTPATIGIVKGQLIVGLSRDEIEYLANKRLSRPIKASRRDIPAAVALGLSAGTTVAATMAIATSVVSTTQRVGQIIGPIKVFATGGTGGVHMGGEHSMDISADLYEFARSPMGVVSSGFKSFLDTRRSLELLETFGCTVLSLAQSTSTGGDHSSDLFPGFFSRTNRQRVKSPRVVTSLEEGASILFHCLEGPLVDRRGVLLAVPIPGEFSLDEDDAGSELARAMDSIAQIDLRTDLEGKEKTPLILEQLNRATGGKTLRANIELLQSNASAGAKLAYEYAKLASRTGARP